MRAFYSPLEAHGGTACSMSSAVCRGVRFQGDNWQARTKRNGKELSLGLYNTAEEAVSLVGAQPKSGFAAMGGGSLHQHTCMSSLPTC